MHEDIAVDVFLATKQESPDKSVEETVDRVRKRPPEIDPL